MGFGIGGSLSGLTSGVIKGATSAATGGFDFGKVLGYAGDALGLAGSVAGLGETLGAFPASERNITNAIRIRVRDAKAAGIHPLFALGHSAFPAGGGTGSGIGDALTAASDTVSGIARRGPAQRRQAAIDAASIDESRARGEAARASALRDRAAAMESASRVARAAQMANATGLGRVRPHPTGEVHPDRRMDTYLFGEKVRPNPWFSSAEGAEAEYHELGGLLFGLVNLFANPLYEAQQRAKKRPRRVQKPPFDPWGGTP